jgi:hypothetical protein
MEKQPVTNKELGEVGGHLLFLLDCFDIGRKLQGDKSLITDHMIQVTNRSIDIIRQAMIYGAESE